MMLFIAAVAVVILSYAAHLGAIRAVEGEAFEQEIRSLVFDSIEDLQDRTRTNISQYLSTEPGWGRARIIVAGASGLMAAVGVLSGSAAINLAIMGLALNVAIGAAAIHAWSTGRA